MAALIVRAASLVALAPLLVACSILDEQHTAVERADTALFAQTELVGLSRAEILACAGKPDRAVRNGDSESLVYTSSGAAAAKPGAPAGKPCEVTFAMHNGYVEKVAYSVPSVGGFGGFASGDQCSYVVQKCMRPR